MIKGTQFWNDRDRFWVQTKNGIEAILRAALPRGTDGVPRGWLETCGPTAAVNVMDSMGKNIAVKSPTNEPIRPMDYLALWMNTPANWSLLSSIVPGVDPDRLLENEVAPYYPVALQRVFGVQVTYYKDQTFEWLAASVQSGKGAMICLVTPGHFLAVVAYDDTTQELIYNDSWPDRTRTDGFNLRMKKTEWLSNVKPYTLIFS